MRMTTVCASSRVNRDGGGGDPFYVDQGGDHQLRICYTSQPASRAEQIAKTLARSLAAAQRAGGEPPPAVRMV